MTILGQNELTELLEHEQNNEHEDSNVSNCMVSIGHSELTHWGLVMPYGDIDLGQHWLR